MESTRLLGHFSWDRVVFVALFAFFSACGDDSGATDVGVDTQGDVRLDVTGDPTAFDVLGDTARDVQIPDVGDTGDSGAEDAPVDAAQPCSTRVTYGSSWLRPEGHPENYDDIDGNVSWDGVCQYDGVNSFAVLSNGWRPYFAGRGSCVIALDHRGSCQDLECSTRVSYGATWLAPPNHPNRYDDVPGVVSWGDGVCRRDGGTSAVQLSNGWEPHFSEADFCDISFRYTGCGGLYANPVIDHDCPDPGVLEENGTYYLVCTGRRNGFTFPMYVSTNLVDWMQQGGVFPDGTGPAWANDRHWAPEVHRVDSGLYIAYFSASRRSDNRLVLGAAISTSPTGPFTDIGRPLLSESLGIIDAHFFRASNGQRYLTWKVDGNAVGRPTPIRIQRIAADGITLEGSPTTVLTNDQRWEGALVEGQWLLEHDGYFYMFYSANGYATSRYGVGVARSRSPEGPYEKMPAQVLQSAGAWAGPGHGSVVRGPNGGYWHVYHAWRSDRVGQPPGRLVLLDRVSFIEGWPRMYSTPSSRSQPLP